MVIDYSKEDVRLLPAIIGQVFGHPLDLWQEVLETIESDPAVENVLLELLGNYVAGLPIEDCYKKCGGISLTDLIFLVPKNEMPIYQKSDILVYKITACWRMILGR